MKNTKSLRRSRWLNSICKLCGASILISAISSHATVLVVSTLADSGPGSLRDQVASSSSGDTIQFAVNGTIVLSSSINIDHTLLVMGPGASELIVNANFVDRAFVTGGHPGFLSGIAI